LCLRQKKKNLIKVEKIETVSLGVVFCLRQNGVIFIKERKGKKGIFLNGEYSLKFTSGIANKRRNPGILGVKVREERFN